MNELWIHTDLIMGPGRRRSGPEESTRRGFMRNAILTLQGEFKSDGPPVSYLIQEEFSTPDTAGSQECFLRE